MKGVKMTTDIELVSIQQAARLVGRQAQYIRQLVLKEKLIAIKSTVPGTDIPRWEIDKKSVLDYFKGNNRRVGRRQDGRNKWVVYATPAELVKVKEVLAANGLAEVVATIDRAQTYNGKAKTKVVVESEPKPEPKPEPSVPSKAARAAARAARAAKTA
jgi:hypothetical protein